MKQYASADLRNFAIVGHATSGKTMLSEAIHSVVDTGNRVIEMLSMRDIPSERHITYHQSKVAQTRRAPMTATQITLSFRRLFPRS